MTRKPYVRCKIQSSEGERNIFGAWIDEEIDRENADEIIRQLKGDKYLRTDIEERDTHKQLRLWAKSPTIIIKCKYIDTDKVRNREVHTLERSQYKEDYNEVEYMKDKV